LHQINLPVDHEHDWSRSAQLLSQSLADQIVRQKTTEYPR
jgi:hypothetical protein